MIMLSARSTAEWKNSIEISHAICGEKPSAPQAAEPVHSMEASGGESFHFCSEANAQLRHLLVCPAHERILTPVPKPLGSFPSLWFVQPSSTKYP